MAPLLEPSALHYDVLMPLPEQANDIARLIDNNRKQTGDVTA
jgi:hypothetical protein